MPIDATTRSISTLPQWVASTDGQSIPRWLRLTAPCLRSRFAPQSGSLSMRTLTIAVGLIALSASTQPSPSQAAQLPPPRGLEPRSGASRNWQAIARQPGIAIILAAGTVTAAAITAIFAANGTTTTAGTGTGATTTSMATSSGSAGTRASPAPTSSGAIITGDKAPSRAARSGIRRR